MIPKTAFQQLDDKQIKESAKVAQRVGNSRASSPVTRDGALRGKQCRAIVGDWQRRKNIGDAFCQNEPLENGYCRLHQSLVVAKKSRTRGQQQIIARYQKIGEEKPSLKLTLFIRKNFFLKLSPTFQSGLRQ